MTRRNSRNSIHALLVSTSVVGLASGGALYAGDAQAQGIEVVNTTLPGVLNPLGSSTDYILISNSTVTTDGVVNNGDIGDVSPNATGILVTNGSTVNGGITNSGNLFADETGIRIEFTDIPDGITNGGQLIVGSGVAGTDVEEAYGIVNFGTSIDTSISNSGLVEVIATATAEGGSALAYGVDVRAFTNLNATVDNSGTMNVSAEAGGASEAEAAASGIWVELSPSEAPPPANAVSSITNSSSSTIDVSAIAEASASGSDSAEANAEGVGIGQLSESADSTSFSASNSGSLLVDVLAMATTDSASAEALATGTGILQSAEGGGNADTSLTATNSGLIQVDAEATATVSSGFGDVSATAKSVGINQDADFAGDMTLSASNSGNISVSASATADAPDHETFAIAEAQGIRQDASGGESINQTSNVSVTQSGNVDVTAIAKTDGRSNGAGRATAQGVVQITEGVDSASASVVNSGNIAASAAADGEFGGQFSFHQAFRAEATGIYQEAFVFDGPLSQTVTSSGSISASATAGLDETFDSDDVVAEAFGIRQMASGYGALESTAHVTGDIDATAITQANGVSNIFADAYSRAAGIDQFGQSYDGSIQFEAVTDGNTDVLAIANAEGSSGASANAMGTGIAQHAIGDTLATASASNNGTMIVGSHASADGGFGYSNAEAFGAGIKQFRRDGVFSSGEGQGQFVGFGVINSSFSTIDVSVTATVTGSGSGTAVADGFGITQDIGRGSDATANATNSGGISVSSSANATSSGIFTLVNANSLASGIHQSVFSGSGNVSGNISSGVMSVASFANAGAPGSCANAFAFARSIGLDQMLESSSGAASGNIAVTTSLDVSATASATASSSADAFAEAFGVRQNLYFADAGTSNLHNSGNINVSAEADANAAGFGTYATAQASGMSIFASDGPLSVQANNAGNIVVTAMANTSFGSEDATASGISIFAGDIVGTVVNNGNIMVSASAPNGSADAYGIRVMAESFSGTIGNYGTITAEAIEAVPSTAYGIYVGSNSEGVSGEAFTIENDGTIDAEVAINTENAPGPATIEQLGGLILGDLELNLNYADTVEHRGGTILGDTFGSGDDVFNFRSGSGSGAPTANYVGDMMGLASVNVYPGMAYLDGSVTSTAAFNVMSGGYLTLSSNGPTQISVSDYTQVSGSILAYEITPDPNSAAQISGGNVSLGGGVTVAPLPGFYPNAITYEEVVVSSGGSPGQWDSVIDTALLDVEAIYQGDDTVDLSVTRIPFDEVEGLDPNAKNVGKGIEKIYEDSQGTPLGEAIEELFLLDLDAYNDLLASISGSEYAQGLQALLDTQGAFQNAVLGHLGNGGGAGNGQTASLGSFDFISSQMAAAASDEGGRAAPPRQQLAAAGNARDRAAGSVGIWGRGYGNFGDNDGDSNAPGFDQQQFGFAIGADVAVAEGLLLGLAGGYSDTDLDFDGGNDLDYEGFQVAAYGSFSPGPWYLDGMVSYAWYDNDSRRATIGGTAKGDYDSEVFTTYAETGYAFEIEQFTVTPFAGIGYAHADTDSFTESGAGAFDLSVDDADAESLTSTLGVDFSARLKMSWEVVLIPELRLGWEHEYLDDQQSVGMHFAGMPASSYNVLSSEVADDSAVVGAGFTLEMGDVWQVFLDYDGKLNEDYSQHAVSGGVKLTW